MFSQCALIALLTTSAFAGPVPQPAVQAFDASYDDLFAARAAGSYDASLTRRASSYDVQVTGEVQWEIPSTLYGLLFADIRHSGDGGLYSELLQNRALQLAENHYPWLLVGDAHPLGIAQLDTPISPQLPNSLNVTVPTGTTGGLGQYGYWGIPATENQVFNLSFYVRTATHNFASAPLVASLVSYTTGDTVATTTVTADLSPTWLQINTTLKASSTPPDAWNNFTLTIDTSDDAFAEVPQVTLFVGMFTLEPQNTWNKDFNGHREDLEQAVIDLKPGFWRWPGGNNMEGTTIDTRWQWNLTLGPLYDRPGRPGTWGYTNTDGEGLMEALRWCEETGMSPFMSVWAGYALNGRHVPEDKLDQYIQIAIDQLNFITADADSNAWAAVRRDLGHPEPFALEYVEIGNEDFFDTSGSYTYRWKDYVTKLQAAFPDLKFIATTYVDDPELTPDPGYWDIHEYNTPAWFIQNAYLFDEYDRDGTKYSMLEYAVTSTNTSCYNKAACDRSEPHTMVAASAEAMFALGMERNSDIVFASAYGVTYQRAEATDYTSDLIHFNSTALAKTTAYYMMQLYSTNLGSNIVSSTKPTNDSSGVIWTTSIQNSTGDLIIKLANAGDASSALSFSIPNYPSIASTGKAILLAGDGANTLETIDAVKPVESTFDAGSSFSYTLPAYSAAVLIVNTGGTTEAAAANANVKRSWGAREAAPPFSAWKAAGAFAVSVLVWIAA